MQSLTWSNAKAAHEGMLNNYLIFNFAYLLVQVDRLLINVINSLVRYQKLKQSIYFYCRKLTHLLNPK